VILRGLCGGVDERPGVERWKKLVADFETSDLTQRECAS